MSRAPALSDTSYTPPPPPQPPPPQQQQQQQITLQQRTRVETCQCTATGSIRSESVCSLSAAATESFWTWARMRCRLGCPKRASGPAPGDACTQQPAGTAYAARKRSHLYQQNRSARVAKCRVCERRGPVVSGGSSVLHDGGARAFPPRRSESRHVAPRHPARQQWQRRRPVRALPRGAAAQLREGGAQREAGSRRQSHDEQQRCKCRSRRRLWPHDSLKAFLTGFSYSSWELDIQENSLGGAKFESLALPNFGQPRNKAVSECSEVTRGSTGPHDDQARRLARPRGREQPVIRVLGLELASAVRQNLAWRR